MRAMAAVALTACALFLALFLVAVVNLAAETPRFVQWCTEQGGVLPNGAYSDPMCIRDGLVLIPPKDANARWPE